MKITLLTPFFPHPKRGHAHGAERYAEGLALGLKKAGHHVKIVTSYYNGTKKHDFFQGIPILRVHDSNSLLHHHGSIFFLHYISFGLNATRKSNFKFYEDSDVIITDIAFGFLRAIRKKKIPLISVFFHYDEDQSTKGFFYRMFYVSFLRFLEKYHFRKTRNIITISQKSKLDLIQKYGIPEDYITVIPIGIDLKKFNPKNFSPEIRKIYGSKMILYSALTVYRKRLPLLLKAMPIILKEIPNAQLILTGGGPLWEPCKILAKFLKIERNTTFLGFIREDELKKLFATSDLFVLPSEKEGFGQVLTEAMASGTPVICSNVPPMSEIIENGGKTFIVNNYRDLAQKIISLLKNQEDLNLYRERALNVARKYDWSRIVNLYIDYIKNIKYLL
ncbi:MAG: glycosyltransferase family 4 protein [Promethearchaeota archaeon]